MTETERKALALVNEIERQEGLSDLTPRIMRGLVMDEALCRAIEQHEAFRQEVSDAVEWVVNSTYMPAPSEHKLRRFIIRKPDPLAEAWIEATGNTVGMEPLNAALAARGLKIVEDK